MKKTSIKNQENPFKKICIPIKVIDNCDYFIGRVPELKRFVADIETFKKGAFLVTGYKGIGKTRFVQQAISELKDKNNEQWIHVSISLGNGSIAISDVLDDLYYQLENNEAIPDFVKNHLDFIRQQRNKREVNRSGNEQLGVKLAGINAGKTTNTSEKSTIEPASIRVLETQLINLINVIVDPQKLQAFVKGTTAKFYFDRELNRFLEGETKKDHRLIFTFDELDKVELNLGIQENNKERKRSFEIDRLLGAMKRLFTEAHGTFIFIAGKNILDMYHGEIGNTEALYEHLFKQIYYVPSLLRDQTIGERSRLSRMIEEYVFFRIKGETSYTDPKKPNSKNVFEKIAYDKEDYKSYSPFSVLTKRGKLTDEVTPEPDEIKNAILVLRNFSNFLTFHSWGNFDILDKYFNSFLRVEHIDSIPENFYDPLELRDRAIKCAKDNNINYLYYLEFDSDAFHRIMTASNLYTLFYQGLGRHLNASDDRLVVSSFILYHHILKLHKSGFSKKHIEIASQAIYGSGLNQLSAIGETIINSVLYPFIRATFGGFHQYRFFHSFEIQLDYLVNMDATDTATFSFSTETHTDVRKHYENLFKRYEAELGHGDDRSGVMTKAKIQETLGDFCIWDKRYDEAFIYYGGSDTSLNENDRPEEINFANLQFSIQTLMKLGSLEEMRGDYTLAESFYLQAEHVVKEAIDTKLQPHLIEQIERFPDKFHILRNAYLARIYLNAKRHTSAPFELDLLPQNIANILFKNIPYISYKLGIANFFSDHFETAFLQFHKAYNQSTEGSDYLKAISGVKIAQTYIIKKFKSVNLQLPSDDSEVDDGKYIQLQKKILDNLIDTCSPISSNDKVEAKTISFEQLVSFQESELFEKLDSCSALTVLDFLSIQQQRMKRLGLHSQSARIILVHIATCVLILESIPWRLIDEDALRTQREAVVSIANQLRKSVNGMLDEMKMANLRSYQSTFAMFRTSFYKEYLLNSSDGAFASRIPYGEQNDEDMFALGNAPHIDWQFSPVGEMFLMFRLWLVRAQQIISLDFSDEQQQEFKNIEQAKVLPQNSWAYAVSLWLSGRNLVKQSLISGKNNHSTNCTASSESSDCEKVSELKAHENKAELSDDDIEIAKTAIQYLTQSVYYFLQISDNDRHIIIPSISQVTYNIWELLFFLVETKMETSQITYDVAVDHVQTVLRPSEIGVRSTSFLNLEYTFKTTLYYLEEVIGFNEAESSVRRDVLSNKHFINDDFEDSSFGMFWMYFCSFNDGAKLHWLELKRSMNKLYKLSQERHSKAT